MPVDAAVARAYTAAVLTGALTRALGEAAGSYAISQGTLSANANYTIAFTGNTLVITAPPPPPAEILPIAPQTNTDGDEVELHVTVVRSSASPAMFRNSSIRRNDDEEHDVRGQFSISGLNGLRIDKDGEIDGRIRAGVTDVTVFKVMVTFTENGVTATEEITWTVKPAPARRGGKG
jgi:hypothetical protein